MKQIRIDFLLGPDWQSRLIAWYGQGSSGYSHCASVLADGRYLDARSDVLNHIPAGVHIRSPESERWIKKRRATLQVTDGEYAAWEANLRAKITTQYASSDILDFIFGTAKLPKGHWDCSALAINAVQHIKKVVFPLVIPAHQVTPNTALLLLQQAGFNIGPEMHA